MEPRKQAIMHECNICGELTPDLPEELEEEYGITHPCECRTRQTIQELINLIKEYEEILHTNKLIKQRTR